MTEFRQSLILCIAAVLALTPNAVNALSATLYPQKNGLCSSFRDLNDGSYNYICGVRTMSAMSDDAIYRVSMYTGIPKDSIPSEKTRPKYSEYYEWTGFTNLRLDDNGCLQPVDKTEAGAFITSNNCPPAPYPISTRDAPDIINPYHLVQKSRENINTGQPQSFLQPDYNYAEPSPGAFVTTGITDNKVAADAAFSGGDAELFDPVVADQVASTPVVDDTFYGWGAATMNFERKLKQRRGIKRRGGVERVVGGMT